MSPTVLVSVAESVKKAAAQPGGAKTAAAGASDAAATAAAAPVAAAADASIDAIVDALDQQIASAVLGGQPLRAVMHVCDNDIELSAAARGSGSNAALVGLELAMIGTEQRPSAALVHGNRVATPGVRCGRRGDRDARHASGHQREPVYPASAAGAKPSAVRDLVDRRRRFRGDGERHHAAGDDPAGAHAAADERLADSSTRLAERCAAGPGGMGNQQAVRPKPPQQRGIDRGAEPIRAPVLSLDGIERAFAIGNQAAVRLRPGRPDGEQVAPSLKGSGSAPHALPVIPASPRSTRAPFLLQRNCACGGGATRDARSAGAGRPGTCETKLQIDEAGDEYEQEADRVAADVMAAPDRSAADKPIYDASTEALPADRVPHRPVSSASFPAPARRWSPRCAADGGALRPRLQ